MKAIRIIQIVLLVLGGFTFYNCQTEDIVSGNLVLDLPNTPYVYNVGSNDHLPTLGRVLFYDTRLSTNNSVSCASCHKQQLAFADRSDFSLGFENRLTGRNSMPIQNIISDTFFFFGGSIDSIGFGGIEPANNQVIIDPRSSLIEPGFFPTFFQPTALFWDGRQHSLETMVMEPIKNHIEMGTTNLENLATKLSQIPEYEGLFANAFDQSGVTPEKIAKALSAFLVSIRSNQSKFDKSLNGLAQLSGLEQFGKDLFFDKYDCNSCHQLQAPFNGYQLAGGKVNLEDLPILA